MPALFLGHKPAYRTTAPTSKSAHKQQHGCHDRLLRMHFLASAATPSSLAHPYPCQSVTLNPPNKAPGHTCTEQGVWGSSQVGASCRNEVRRTCVRDAWSSCTQEGLTHPRCITLGPTTHGFGFLSSHHHPRQAPRTTNTCPGTQGSKPLRASKQPPTAHIPGTHERACTHQL